MLLYMRDTRHQKLTCRSSSFITVIRICYIIRVAISQEIDANIHKYKWYYYIPFLIEPHYSKGLTTVYPVGIFKCIL